MVYQNTFIQVAPDTTATQSKIPTPKGDKKTVPWLQYELLSSQPYHYSHEDLIYAVYIHQQNFSADELAARGTEIRATLLSKEHPCLRASALTKQYGWGAHYNAEGKIALYALESAEYQAFSTAPAVRQLLAMRSKRA
jgi:hypothetical protein